MKAILGMGLALACLGMVAACGDGGSSDDEKVSSMRDALLDLPYRVVLRDVETPPGARGVVTGKATDAEHGRTVRFAFILGAPEGKWLRKYVGSDEDGSFNWELDMQSATQGPVGKTWPEKEEIAEMKVEIENAVCEALSGKPCPI